MISSARFRFQTDMSANVELVIKARRGWQPADVGELWRYRELLLFLAWRDIQVRYKQTLLGGLWALLQPLVGTIILAAAFSRVVPAKEVGCPYVLFVCAGLIPWTFFANALGLGSASLVGNEKLISKTYFPRLLIPLGTVLALTIDLVIGLLLIAVLLAVFRWAITPAVFLLPLFVAGSLLAAGGLSLFLSACNVKYRDVRYVVPFMIQMAFFVTPIAFPISLVPPSFAAVLALNPMAGMVEGFRHALLGTPAPWALIGVSVGMSAALFVGGVYFFRRMERTFADVI